MLCKRKAPSNEQDLAGPTIVKQAFDNRDTRVFWWLIDGANGRASAREVRRCAEDLVNQEIASVRSRRAGSCGFREFFLSAVSRRLSHGQH